MKLETVSQNSLISALLAGRRPIRPTPCNCGTGYQLKLNNKEDKYLKEICCFIIKCYIKAWFSAPNAIEDCLKDILFLKILGTYKS